ncbi:MAG: hypothetical protein EXX96DRAFT_609600 [Benjaminiella poitrasii]|nr:MAG: hypothetical protein EXX96DRAFT_609600 [Benjaminiella poitrasii]
MSDSFEMSEECKAYEKFAVDHWQDDPFPMVKNKLIRYIKVRARCSTFVNFITNLDKHPLHGPEWFMRMSNDPDIQKVMSLAFKIWPRQMRQCRSPIIGLGVINEDGQYESPWTTIEKQAKQYESKVKVIEKPGGIKGFMVPDDDLKEMNVNEGSSFEHAIVIDEPTSKPFQLTLSDRKALLARYSSSDNGIKDTSEFKARKKSPKELLAQYKSMKREQKSRPKPKTKQETPIRASKRKEEEDDDDEREEVWRREDDDDLNERIDPILNEDNNDFDYNDFNFDFSFDAYEKETSSKASSTTTTPSITSSSEIMFHEPIIRIKLKPQRQKLIKKRQTMLNINNNNGQEIKMDDYITAWYGFHSDLLASRINYIEKHEQSMSYKKIKLNT